MGLNDLKAKYGTTQTRQTINAAIRNEIPGGAALLDDMKDVYVQAKSVTNPKRGEASRRLDELRKLRLEFVRKIVEKYEIELAPEKW